METAILMEFGEYLQREDRSSHTISAYTNDVRAFFAWLKIHLGESTAPML